MEPTDSLTNNSSSNNIHWKIEQFVYEKENYYDDYDGHHNDHYDHNDHDDHIDSSDHDHDGPHPGSGAPVLLGRRPHSKRAGEHQDKTTFEQNDDIEQQQHCLHPKNDAKGLS